MVPAPRRGFFGNQLLITQFRNAIFLLIRIDQIFRISSTTQRPANDRIAMKKLNAGHQLRPKRKMAIFCMNVTCLKYRGFAVTLQQKNAEKK